MSFCDSRPFTVNPDMLRRMINNLTRREWSVDTVLFKAYEVLY